MTSEEQMIHQGLLRLYPAPAPPAAPYELALEQDLIGTAKGDTPWIYGSFLMSLNGAMAVADATGAPHRTTTLSDPRDLLLLHGLMAQADCLITTSGYLRDLDCDRLGNLLQVRSTPGSRVLHDYRARHRARPHPDLLVLSRSLDFPLPRKHLEPEQNLRVLTCAQAPGERLRALREEGVDVQVCPDSEWIGADSITAALRDLGARTAYLFCGPQTCSVLLQAGHLRRLYLTWCHLLQGGDPVLNPGSRLPAQAAPLLQLRELYQAEPAGELPGLWFAAFDAGAP